MFWYTLYLTVQQVWETTLNGSGYMPTDNKWSMRLFNSIGNVSLLETGVSSTVPRTGLDVITDVTVGSVGLTYRR